MSIVSAVLGACIGSFLNVVIYRLPRGLSISNPRRSFCPHCGCTIAGYDNIPVLSYLLLRGRCRRCRAPISAQYPLIELVTALLFVATYDVLIVSRWRVGVGVWPQDGAIVVAHWALWAGLLATAVMDVEAYHLDVRVTWVVTIVGIACNTLWTPDSSQGWIRPGPAMAAGSIAATLALAVTALYAIGRTWGAQEGEDERIADELSPQDESAEVGRPDANAPAGRMETAATLLTIVIGLAAIGGYLWWMNLPSAGAAVSAATAIPSASAVVRLGLVAAVLLVLTIAATSVPRAADEEIFEAIEAERTSARRVALRELVWLAPSIAAGIVAIVAWRHAFAGDPAAANTLLNWAPVGQWRPILGLATGLSGWLLAGALGWAVRLGFTLVLGKEALGVGDIHILAAAGAVTAWLTVVFGFFVSAPLALLGVLFFLLRRRSRAIQYGPWLALGIFLAAAAQDRIIGAMNIGWLVR